MPRVAAPIKNGETLDRVIADKLAEMAERGITGQRKMTVGGHPPGLMLQITAAGASSWLLRTTVNGTRREIGLGAYRRAGASSRERPSVSLSEARALAKEYHGKIGEGRDPVAERKQARAKQRTFRDVAIEFLEANQSAWRNPKHRQQWRNTLETYAYPKIGDVPIATLDKHQIRSVLMQPLNGSTLWLARHETATRLRQRMERVCRYAKAHDYREGENPAAWKEVLEDLLPEVSDEIKEVNHHAALSYTDAASFMTKLRKRRGTAAQALQFLIYTAARSGEVRLAEWDEIDLGLRLWTIPKGRMKMRKQHTVPLSEQAIAILQTVPEGHRKGLIFPGAKRGKPMSDMTLAAVLKRMDRADITVHGFRSTFRDWGGEVSSHPERVLENALAHQLDDGVAAAYARGKQLEKRRAVMDDWARYLQGD
ncbi:MAG: tyrosine-type recombinase/integrase [Verrucomicrobiales bacterium]|nr:tyrosine-type recombinase/integrase [Verrucomicrobiales bacterium]